MHPQSQFRKIPVSLLALVAIFNSTFLIIEIVKAAYALFSGYIKTTNVINVELIWIWVIQLLISISVIRIICNFDDIVDQAIFRSALRRYLIKEHVYIIYALFAFVVMVFSYLVFLRGLAIASNS